MKVEKRGGTKIILNHVLDKIRNPSEACLPLDLAYLAVRDHDA